MKRTVLTAIMVLAVLSSSLAYIPSVRSDVSTIQIVDYSHYFDEQDILWVVGEVKNVGTYPVRDVILSAIATQGDGAQTEPTTGYAAWGKYILPGGKAPFAFPIDNTNTASGAWTNGPLKKIDLTINQADDTPLYQYQDLTITDKSYSITDEGAYLVSGQIQNAGSQTVKGLVAVVSFYNSEGTTVAAGYEEAVQTTLVPSAKTVFSVVATDLDTMSVGSERVIASYSVSLQVASPLLEMQGALPTPATTVDSGPVPSSVGSFDDLVSFNLWIVVGVVLVIAAVVTVLVVMRMRKPKTAASIGQKQLTPKKRRKR